MKKEKIIQNEEVPEILPLTNDLVFKRVFSREENTDMLKSLLEAILKIDITKVEIKNPELNPNFKDNKVSVLDVKAEINGNVIVDVEMQMKNEKNLTARTTKYLGGIVDRQLSKHEDYNELKKTIIIFIMDFNYYKTNSYHNISHEWFDEIDPKEYVNMGYKNEDKLASDYMEFHYIELPKFRKKLKEVPKTMLEKWLCLIVGKEEMIDMEDEENKDLKNAYEKIREFSASEEEIELYYSRVLAETNYKDDMSYMLKKGEKRGEERGEKLR